MAENFSSFAKKVLGAAKKGGLTAKDVKKLDRLLTRDGKRYKILAAGLVSALKTGATEKDIEDVSALFEKAAERIAEEKEPFTKNEAETLKKILIEAGISLKTSRWVSRHVDDLLATEIQEFISGKKLERGFVPAKKSVSFESEATKAEEKKKVRI